MLVRWAVAQGILLAAAMLILIGVVVLILMGIRQGMDG